MVDEFTHESLAIRVWSKVKSIDVIAVLSEPFVNRGGLGFIRSDNDPELVIEAVKIWIAPSSAQLLAKRNALN